MIYNVSKLIENEKYTLYNEDGTVLASNIYVSTISSQILMKVYHLKN